MKSHKVEIRIRIPFPIAPGRGGGRFSLREVFGEAGAALAWAAERTPGGEARPLRVPAVVHGRAPRTNRSGAARARCQSRKERAPEEEQHTHTHTHTHTHSSGIGPGPWRRSGTKGWRSSKRSSLWGGEHRYEGGRKRDSRVLRIEWREEGHRELARLEIAVASWATAPRGMVNRDEFLID